MTPVRIALVDDHPVVLAGIRALLQGVPEVELVGEANTGASGLQAICECAPDIAVIDLSLPDISGMELARQLGRRCPKVKIIALTVHEDRAYIHPVLEAGARGYLLKRSAGDELLRAIRAVNRGDVYLDPAIAEKASIQAPELAAASDGDVGREDHRQLLNTIAGSSRITFRIARTAEIVQITSTAPALIARICQGMRNASSEFFVTEPTSDAMPTPSP